ncbi:glycosyltransferase family 58 protein [Tilletiaria anomala UBC 951]|uniref:Dol-P-Man:Man(5)GlcNAc(2)-PP-Dol alpha-1,3-mannosyltransferase n=1 Tax=Tilletiaria anomala (strain ATCC 24038 / CBS 436.72 / UBC 951) TaxID=1037660 RepID=A0A066WFX2_TILAU|nr:glycosyltransferase family 58 protein [Tilletiaria anomala UBC 951]KDN52701.1 glycosyltransferase family 58 protein [Tilletiaria anomala UBC 951]
MAQPQRPMRRFLQFIHDFLFTHAYSSTFTSLFLLVEGTLLIAIIHKVRYTEIDFSTYLQQADLYVNQGVRDYAAIKGDSGPCVYPAGHLFVYGWILRIIEQSRPLVPAGLLGNKSEIPPEGLRTVQYFFAGLYLLTFRLVMNIYYMASFSYQHEKPGKVSSSRSALALASRSFPPALHLVTFAMSKRLHSIFVLRLFNDPVAMAVFYLATVLLCKRAVISACLLYSFALSIKMNLLLFLPAWGLILARAYGISADIPTLLIPLVQLVLGYPFLEHNAKAYLRQAFDFRRAFMYEWTVNWRFVSVDSFMSSRFAHCLLACHVFALLCFAAFKWTELGRKGPVRWLREDILLKNSDGGRNEIRGWPTPRYIVTTLFTANLIGITFSRSLHYQFFSWYAHQIPFLLWSADLPLPVKLALPVAISYGWETFPSTSLSSGMLFAAHLVLLYGVWRSEDGDALTDGIRSRLTRRLDEDVQGQKAGKHEAERTKRGVGVRND